MNRIEWLIHTALSYLGTPYQWGGDDPEGFDCSGFIVECLQSVGVLPDKTDFTADRLWQRFTDYEIEGPIKGALMFRLNSAGKATHVELCLDEGFRIGASGGNSSTISIQDAWDQNAFVKIRPIGPMNSRKKFIYPFLKGEK